MRHYFPPFEMWFAPLELPPDQLRRRTYLLYATLILTPLSLYFGLVNYQHDGWSVTTLFCFISVAISPGVLFLLRYQHNERFILRLVLFYMLAMLTTIVAVGGGEGTSYCWFYIYPIVAYYIFGQREGSIWTILSWIQALLFVFLNLGPYNYSVGVGARFLFSYTQVALLAYGLEYSRVHYYNRLMAEKQKVEETLREVYTLQNLLPICPNCKNVRDDAGYWHQVESYMTEHTGIEFSHGICPDCRQKMFDSLNQFKAAQQAKREGSITREPVQEIE